MSDFKKRYIEHLSRPARKGGAKVKNAVKKVYYSTVKLYLHQLFRSTFEDAIVAWNPDVVHAHDGLSLPLAGFASKRAKSLMVYDSHELEAHRSPPLSSRQKRNVERIEQAYLPKADAVTTIGQRYAEHLETRYGIARPHVIYNAPPLQERPLPKKWQQPKRTSLRAEANVSDDTVVLVYTGNVTINRGCEQALEGLACYLKRADAPQKVHLSMVGKPRAETVDEIKTLANALYLNDHIHFHDPVSPTAVVDFIAEGDIAIIPVIPAALSYDYAMPNKLFESMLAGLPILGARLAEMAPFIEKHALGVCYDPLSSESFADGLEQLLVNGKAARLSPARKHELGVQFSWEAQEKVLLDVYEKLETSKEVLRIAMVVPNPCNPDYRVVKQAETLAAAGHKVRVFCTRPVGFDLPDSETLNDVEYHRIDWSVRSAADNFLKFHWRRLKALKS